MNLLKEGDANTKFFHVVANGRKNRNFIPKITHGGTKFADTLEIGRIFTSGFRAQFGLQRDNRFKTNWQRLLSIKALVDLSNHEVPFSVEEIRSVIFALGADKAPGSDGFPIYFFQKFWDVVQTEVVILCEDFYFVRANLE